MNSFLQNHTSSFQPHASLIRITVIFWIIAKIISFKLWTAERFFPLTPPIDILSSAPSWLHLALYVIALICFICLIAYPLRYFFISAAFITELASCILDQNRWQPWEYQYIFILLIFILNRKNTRVIIPLILIILSSTYFYSGISKLNPEFIPRVWERFMTSGVLKLNKEYSYYNIVKFAGYCIPLIEITAGICLLVTKFRKSACLILIIMHVLVLVNLSPLGLNFNKIVWPWNIAMICYLIFYYKRSDHNFYWSVILKKRNWAILIFWGLLPVLNVINYWDDYLSSNLYSGKTKNLFICMKVKSGEPYPAELINRVNTYPKGFCNQGKVIDITTWSMQELRVPCYPEKRIFFVIERTLKKRYPNIEFEFFIVNDTR